LKVGLVEKKLKKNIGDFRVKKLTHKFNLLDFVRSEGFIFQELLRNQGLKIFVEIQRKYYPSLG